MKRNWKNIGLFLILIFSAFLYSCDNNDDDNTTVEGEEITVDKINVVLSDNETETVAILTGNGEYSVKSYSTEIATASVSGTTITINAVSGGATTVRVSDKNGKEAFIEVSVGIFDVTTNVSDTLRVISEQTAQFIVTSGNFSSNSDLTITLDDPTLATISEKDPIRPIFQVNAIKVGKTKINITDKKGKTTFIDLNVDALDIVLSKAYCYLAENNIDAVVIVNGNGNYTVSIDKPTVASVRLINDSIYIQAKNVQDQANITVNDGQGKSEIIQLTVNDGSKSADLTDGNYMLIPFKEYAETNSALKNLQKVTFETRVYIVGMNGESNAKINTIMGLEGKFLLRVAPSTDGSDDVRRLELAVDPYHVYSTTEIKTGQWYDFAVVFDGTATGNDRFKLYIDGNLETMKYTGNTNGGVPNSGFVDFTQLNVDPNFSIGRSDNKRPLNGYINYARIWTKACTASEISSNRNTFVNPVSADLLTYWLFNNGNGSAGTFYSLTNYGYKAIPNAPVTSWRE